MSLRNTPKGVSYIVNKIFDEGIGDVGLVKSVQFDRMGNCINGPKFGVHMHLDSVAQTTGAVLIDRSDTTNFPHNVDGTVYVVGHQISINPDATFVGNVELGFLENVGETAGDFRPYLAWQFNKRADVVNYIYEHAQSPIVSSSQFTLCPLVANDTTWNTNTPVASTFDYTEPYTTIPGDGDVVMKINVVSGTLAVGATLFYFTVS